MTKNVFTIVGGTFTVLGLIFAIGGLFTWFVISIIGLPFFLLGFALASLGLVKASRTQNALVSGRAVPGKITRVYQDQTVRINGRHPWGIEYVFQAEGGSHDGKAQTWDSTAAERKAGQPVHVLYLPGKPRTNTIYPPVK